MTERRQYTPAIKVRLKQLAEQDLYLKRKPVADVANKRYGRLVVVRPVGHGSHGRLIVLCHCDCGGASILTRDALDGGVKSCGCLEAERTGGKLGGQIFKALTRMALPTKPAHDVIGSAQDIAATQAVIGITNLSGPAREAGSEPCVEYGINQNQAGSDCPNGDAND